MFHPNPDFFYKPGGGTLLDIGRYYLTALISMLGPISSCCGYARKTFNERTIQTESRLGETIHVEVPTHISGNLQFKNGTIATTMTSFDVWESELPIIEIMERRERCLFRMSILLMDLIFLEGLY
jgi:predicted dehydrogenase